MTVTNNHIKAHVSSWSSSFTTAVLFNPSVLGSALANEWLKFVSVHQFTGKCTGWQKSTATHNFQSKVTVVQYRLHNEMMFLRLRYRQQFQVCMSSHTCERSTLTQRENSQIQTEPQLSCSTTDMLTLLTSS
jgi:hypothetical protein